MHSGSLVGHLEKLRYFIAVADEGSFAQAARKLRMSQPTLSHSIRMLEEATRVRLFNRASKGVFLTAAGENLYQFGRKMLLDAEQLEHALHLIEDTELGSVMIATKEPYAISHWPRYLKFLEGILPNLEVTMRISRVNAEIMKLLEEEKIDLAMVPDPVLREGVVAYELFVDRFHLYATPEVAAQIAKEKNPSISIYLFQRALCGNGQSFEKVIKDKKLKLKNLKDIDSFNVARSFALKGLGVGLIVDSLVEDDVRAGRLRSIELPYLDPSIFGSIRVCLCMLEKYAKSKRLKKIRHALKQFHSGRANA